MDNIQTHKKFGTREEVYNGKFTQTAGGLKKDDIIEKCFGTKTIYISKKVSDKMKANFNIIRAINPNYFKRIPKHTLVSPQISQLSTQLSTQILDDNKKQKNNITTITTNTINKPLIKKTQKISFNISSNKIKNVYYPELQGININELKNDIDDDDDDESCLNKLSLDEHCVSNKEFTIIDMPDIDITMLQ